MDLIKIDYAENSVDAKELYDFVFKGIKKKTAFNVWISRAIKKYEFIEGEDFQSFLIESTGGRKPVNYAVSIDMAKELSMIFPTPQSKKARKYFIKCEGIAKRIYAERITGIEIRKSLTDKIDDSKENERMHGFAYSSYTKLAYKLCNIEYVKKENFRDTLTEDQLSRVKTVENMIKSMLELGKQYGDIKDCLTPIFKIEQKQIEEVK